MAKQRAARRHERKGAELPRPPSTSDGGALEEAIAYHFNEPTVTVNTANEKASVFGGFRFKSGDYILRCEVAVHVHNDIGVIGREQTHSSDISEPDDRRIGDYFSFRRV